MVKVKKRMGTFIRIYIYKTCRVIMDRENNTRTHTHDTYIMCVCTYAHMCARARYRFKERSRGNLPATVGRVYTGGRCGQAFRTAATVRRGPKDERVCVTPCIYCTGGRLADVPTPLRPPQRHYQSAVARQPSTE